MLSNMGARMSLLQKLLASLQHRNEDTAKYDENLRAEDGFVRPRSEGNSADLLEIAECAAGAGARRPQVSSDVYREEPPHSGGYLFQVGFEREVSGVKKLDGCGRDIATKGFSAAGMK